MHLFFKQIFDIFNAESTVFLNFQSKTLRALFCQGWVSDKIIGESRSRNIWSLMRFTHRTQSKSNFSELYLLFVVYSVNFTLVWVNEILFTFAKVFFQILFPRKEKYVCFLLPAAAYVRIAFLSAKVFSWHNICKQKQDGIFTKMHLFMKTPAHYLIWQRLVCVCSESAKGFLTWLKNPEVYVKSKHE